LQVVGSLEEHEGVEGHCRHWLRTLLSGAQGESLRPVYSQGKWAEMYLYVHLIARILVRLTNNELYRSEPFSQNRTSKSSHSKCNLNLKFEKHP